jgi:hypothetical protein
VILFVDGFVDARERCLITGSKMFHGEEWVSSPCDCPIWNIVGLAGECKG